MTKVRKITGYYYEFKDGSSCWIAGGKLAGKEREKYIAEHGYIKIEKKVAV